LAASEDKTVSNKKRAVSGKRPVRIPEHGSAEPSSPSIRKKKRPIAEPEISMTGYHDNLSHDDDRILSPENQDTPSAVNIVPASEKSKQTKTYAGVAIDPSEQESVDPAALARGDNPMTVVDHLGEFRSRIIASITALFVTTAVFFGMSDYLVHYIMGPYLDTGQNLNIFTLSGGFMIRLKLAFLSSVLLCIPFIIYQGWRFVQPAVSIENKRFAKIWLISFVFLFYSGIAFVFMFIVPTAIGVFLSFIGSDMVCTISAGDYVFFVAVLCFSIGFIFEFPLLIMILTRIGVLTPSFLIRNRKYSIVIIWVTAALITPRDVLSQIMVALPLMGLYEISIVISKITVIRKKRSELLKAEREYRSAGTA